MDHKQAVNAVKAHLWGMAYSVREVADIPGVTYDLLVANKYPLDVMELEASEEGKSKSIVRKGAEYLAIVYGGKTKIYAKGEVTKSGSYRFSDFQTSTYAVFGKPEKIEQTT